MNMKLRVWNKVGCIMMHSEGMWLNEFFGEIEELGESVYSDVMGCSGLQDKNKNDIYAGDIISLIAKNGEEIKVVCEYGINRRDGMDIPSYYFKTSTGYGSYPIVKNYAGKHDCEIFEVIGNIYKTPELLNP